VGSHLICGLVQRTGTTRTASLGMRDVPGSTSHVPGKLTDRLTVSVRAARLVTAPSGMQRARRPVPYEIVPAALRPTALQVGACSACPPVLLRDLDSPCVEPLSAGCRLDKIVDTYMHTADQPPVR
jgi:hypothetical protein